MLKKLLYILPFIGIAFILQLFTSCKKDILFSKNFLEFSVDTVLFDTVFTTVGSTTQRFMIYNKENKPVKIDKVVLKGGKSSPFRINLDGESGLQFTNVTLPARDSLFMFVEVTLGENDATTPLIVEDEVQFLTNGKEQEVKLVAWGQDAYFHNNHYVDGIWPNDKPHVIYNLAVVDSAKTLTIQEGTRIYLHKNAMLYVYKGTLKIEGTADNKVTFQGDRLEPFYEDVKGQYYGIYFDHARASSIEHAVIKNGTAGIHIYDNSEFNSSSDYTLTLKSVEIYNHASYGIFNYSGGKIYGENVNIHNNDLYAYFVLEGGDCYFTHSQFLGYGTDGNKPAVAIKNYFTRADGNTYVGDINENSFYNSIIYGDAESQIVFDTVNTVPVNIEFDFNTNFIRQKSIINHSKFVDNTWNKSPKFKSISNRKFKIKDDSPCKNAGSSAYAVLEDILGNSRDMTQPDIGAYELE